MHRMVRLALAVTLASLSTGAQAPAQAPTQAPTQASIVVFGVVRNAQGVAIPGAEVWIDGTDWRVLTSDAGEYRFDRVASGRATLMVRRLGFRPDSQRLSLASGNRTQVSFILDDLAAELEAVLVTASEGSNGRLQQFWARRKVGIGVFITRADIERRRPARTSDLFYNVMGIRVISRGGEPSMLVSSRDPTSASPRRSATPADACVMQYYIDGVLIAPGMFSVDDIVPAHIEAIEVFRGASEVPVTFRGRDAGCGLVAIWTREPPPRTKPKKDDKG